MPDTEKTIFLEHNLRDRAEQVLAKMRSSQEFRASDEIHPYITDSETAMYGAALSADNAGKSLDLAASFGRTSIFIDCDGSGTVYDPLSKVFLSHFSSEQIGFATMKNTQKIQNYEKVKALLEKIKDGQAPTTELDKVNAAIACVELNGARLKIRAKGSCSVAVIVATNENTTEAYKWEDQIGVNLVYMGSDPGVETIAKKSLERDGTLSEMPYDYVLNIGDEAEKGSTTNPVEIEIPLHDEKSSAHIIGYMIIGDGAETKIVDENSTSVKNIGIEDFIHLNKKLSRLHVFRTSPEQDILSIFMENLERFTAEVVNEEAAYRVADDITIVQSMILPNPEFKKLADKE